MKKFICSILIFMFVFTAFTLAPFRPDQKELKILSRDNNKYVVENLRWGFASGDFASARFTTATIDPENIQDVYYWSKNFPPEYLGAHGMLMFRMKSKEGVISEDGLKDIGFVVSVEAWLRTDQEYSMVSGMMPGNYPIIYTVTSYTDGIQRAVNLGKLTIGQYKLNLSHEQKVNLVKYALEESAKDNSEVSYHTTRNSCVTCAVKLINKVLPRKKQLKIWLIPKLAVNPRVVFPRLAPMYLVSKGVAEKMDANYTIDSEINIQLADGDNYYLDISTLPGNWNRRGLSSDDEFILENYLITYFESVEMLKDLEMTNDNSSVSLSVVINEINFDIDRMEDDIIDIFKKDVKRHIINYIGKGYNKVEWSKDLNKKLLDLIENEIYSGKESDFLFSVKDKL